MTKVVAIASPEGGTGKSMLTALLGSEAAAVGKKVLLIDADPQQTLTLWKAQCEVNDIPLTRDQGDSAAERGAAGGGRWSGLPRHGPT
jgi:cellulose biosynthesis protein BcsQ